MYNNGYNIGSDGADDGLVISTAPTNPSDSVLYPRISYGQSGRAWPIVDFNGTEFKLPRMHDVHTGGAASPLTNSNGNFNQQLVGWTVYNIVDGTSGTITAVSGDKTTLTGGPNFDNGDEYIIRPPNGRPYCKHPIAVEGIWVLRTAAALVDLKVKNEAGEGVIQIHQVEVQESLLDGGDMEAGAGNPWIPTGWVNDALDAGDTEAEAVVIHSGSQSIQYNVGATNGEAATYDLAAISENVYVNFGAWGYGTGAVAPRIVPSYNGGRFYLQYSTSIESIDGSVSATWKHITGVARRTGAAIADTGMRGRAAGPLYYDDIFAFTLDPVTLTVTPASAANSLEGTGVRVDGLDRLTSVVPAGYLSANNGDIRWKWTPRHGDTEAVSFGNTASRIATLIGNGNNYIIIYWVAADTLRLQYVANGAASQFNQWATGGSAFTPGTEYEMRLRYWATRMILYVDGVARNIINAATGFVWPTPTTLYFGTQNTGTNQVDAVFSKA